MIKLSSVALWSGLLLTGCSSLVPAPTVDVAVTKETPDAAWSHVLQDFVDAKGRVDFDRLSTKPQELYAYVRHVAAVDLSTIRDPQEKLAFYLNSYNALSMYNILNGGVPRSIAGLGKIKYFFLRKFEIGGQILSLYQYENEIIRKVGEERVHVALNCMSVGCPRLPQEPFEGATLDRVLDRQAREFFNESRNVDVDKEHRTLRLSEILKFYTGDFLKKAPSLAAYVNKYRTEKVPEDFKVEFIPYDWTVNRVPGPS